MKKALKKIKRHPSVALDVSGATARFGGKQNQSDGEKGGHRIEQLKLKGEGS